MSRSINMAIAPEVAEAIDTGRGVVGLETAVLTQGLPKSACPLPVPPHDLDNRPLEWNDQQPVHLQTMRLMNEIIRDGGGIPAMTAVINGVLHIGLSDENLLALADNQEAGKVAVTDLAPAMTQQRTAGTTVSATLALLRMASSQLGRPISVMATGGIGGVHRGWTERLDVSADLNALSRFQCCVVCAGPKAILDVEATRELLETLAVPIIGYKTNQLPRFLAAGTDAACVTQCLENASEIAQVCQQHADLVPGSGSVLVVNEPPEAIRLNTDDLESLCAAAENATESHTGPARTPHLLAELHGKTQGRSLAANISVLVANAQLAVRIATA